MARKRKRKERDAEASFTSASEERQRLTPVEVQEKVFRLAFRGYSERDVDEFLDRITEDVAALHEENKRLREQLAEGGGSSAGLEDAERQAEGIVRQAREHAARLIEEAEARAATAEAEAGAGGAPADALSTSFLLRERQFLQQMAALIQDHARRLKEEARRVTTAAAAGSGTESPATSAAPVAPVVESAPGPQQPAASAPPPPPPPAERPPTEQEGPTARAAALPQPEDQDRSLVLPEAAEERTAPWSQVDEPESSSEEEEEEADPLLSAWERAFTAESGSEGAEERADLHPSEVRNRKDDEGEPSLRELFWGDEGG